MFRSATPQLAAAAIVLSTLCLPGATRAQAPASDDAAIRALVARYTEIREQGDAAALGALFTADADQLVSSGEWRKGRDAVVKGSLTSSQRTQGKRTLTIDAVRTVAAGVAIADSRYEIAEDAGRVRRMWASWLLVKDGDRWKIAAIRNMLPAAPAR
jgi:uncharacterized protein (TIGR02246 family)